MQKIININYQNRNISLEEDALNAFQIYETELNNYFTTQDCGEEIMQDLKNRMAEIFEEKLKSGQPAITLSDIDDMKANIGNPSDFEGHAESKEEPKAKPNEPNSLSPVVAMHPSIVSTRIPSASASSIRTCPSSPAAMIASTAAVASSTSPFAEIVATLISSC